MSFTYYDAEEMVGGSTDYLVGIRASILKWEQIIREEDAGEGLQYSKSAPCGLCFVVNNLNLSNRCDGCPTYDLCREINDGTDPKWVLDQLRRIESELKGTITKEAKA